MSEYFRPYKSAHPPKTIATTKSLLKSRNRGTYVVGAKRGVGCLVVQRRTCYCRGRGGGSKTPVMTAYWSSGDAAWPTGVFVDRCCCMTSRGTTKGRRVEGPAVTRHAAGSCWTNHWSGRAREGLPLRGGSKGVINFPWICLCNAEFSPC